MTTAAHVTRVARMVFRAWKELSGRNARFTEQHVAVRLEIPVHVVLDALSELQAVGVLVRNGGTFEIAHELPEVCPRCEGTGARLVATISAQGEPLVGALACPRCAGSGDHAAALLAALESRRA